MEKLQPPFPGSGRLITYIFFNLNHREKISKRFVDKVVFASGISIFPYFCMILGQHTSHLTYVGDPKKKFKTTFLAVP
jgi:hypothetical protein